MRLVELEEKWIRKIQHRHSVKEADLLVRAYFDEINAKRLEAAYS